MGCAFNNAMMLLTFSPIATYVSAVYDVNILWVNMCSICFSLTFIPMNFVAVKLYNTWRRHNVLRFAILI